MADLASARERSAAIQRKRGAYYTSSNAAIFMARWALAGGAQRVLEPSFGDGAFVQAVRAASDGRVVQVIGAELDEETFRTATGLLEQAHHGDFLAWSPGKVDAVIGNPPYVRLRHLPRDQAVRAVDVSAAELGAPMETSGSVWMPFVLHAARHLRPGGRMAMVLPFEFTYVRYARPLWRYLAETFAGLQLVRVRERLFPEILQDVVLLLADGSGGSTTTVAFEAFNTVADFIEGTPACAASIPTASVIGGERSFMRALLPAELARELDGRLRRVTTPVRAICSFNIGYVCAHKPFFHPDEATRERYQLPTSSLVPALTSSRQLKALRTGQLNADCLFLPPAESPQPGEREYIRHGESLKVHERYKCRLRDPWFVVPGVRTPDLILSVFSERPVLAINDGLLAATNSLLCGFLKRGTAEAFAAGWYSSLTLLGCESEVHSLGGGMMVLVPKEAGNIRIPTIDDVPAGHLEELSRLLARGDVQGAYHLGDEALLPRLVPSGVIDLIRRGANVLAHWRTSARGGRT